MQCKNDKAEYLKNIHEQSNFHTCLSKEIKFKPDFNTENLEKSKKLGKYFVAPEPNWGPKARATGKKQEEKKE